jgi:hypothetical protein
MLHLDDVGAQHRQLIGGKGSRQHVGDVDHPYALEWSRHRVLLELIRNSSVGSHHFSSETMSARLFAKGPGRIRASRP